MSSIPRLIVVSLLLTTVPAAAQEYVPDELRDWQQWVLKDKEYRDCAFYFDRNADKRDDFVCAWPGRLQLNVSSTDARFTQQWSVYADKQWIALPGGDSRPEPAGGHSDPRVLIETGRG